MKFIIAAAAVSALKINGDPVTGFYTPQDIGTGSLDKKYERVAPEHFASGDDDLFMRSMIMNYADEGKLCDEDGKNCKPTGVFTLTEAATRGPLLRFSLLIRASRELPVKSISLPT